MEITSSSAMVLLLAPATMRRITSNSRPVKGVIGILQRGQQSRFTITGRCGDEDNGHRDGRFSQPVAQPLARNTIAPNLRNVQFRLRQPGRLLANKAPQIDRHPLQFSIVCRALLRSGHGLI